MGVRLAKLTAAADGREREARIEFNQLSRGAPGGKGHERARAVARQDRPGTRRDLRIRTQCGAGTRAAGERGQLGVSREQPALTVEQRAARHIGAELAQIGQRELGRESG